MIFKCKKMYLLTILAMSSLAMVGCGNNNATKNDSGKAADASAVKHKTNKSKQDSPKAHHKVSNALWNDEKDAQLKAFIDQWAPTMHQSYVKYDGVHPLKTSVGTTYPDDFSRELVNGQKASIGWSKDGSGKYDYNVVAVYNYDGTMPPTPNRITYFFAFHNGKPVALVDQSRDGEPRAAETINTQVRDNFAKIAGNSEVESKKTPITNDKKPSGVPTSGVTGYKYIGIMIRRLVMPDVDVTTEPGLIVSTGNGDQSTIGEGTVVSTIIFKPEGEMVRYWTLDTDNDLPTVAQKQIEHTISLQELENKFYSNANDRNITDLGVQHARLSN